MSIECISQYVTESIQLPTVSLEIYLYFFSEGKRNQKKCKTNKFSACRLATLKLLVNLTPNTTEIFGRLYVVYYSLNISWVFIKGMFYSFKFHNFLIMTFYSFKFSRVFKNRMFYSLDVSEFSIMGPNVWKYPLFQGNVSRSVSLNPFPEPLNVSRRYFVCLPACVCG